MDPFVDDLSDDVGFSVIAGVMVGNSSSDSSNQYPKIGISLVGTSSSTAPPTLESYGQQAEESTCDGCSMEPQLPVANGAAGAAAAPGLIGDILKGDLAYKAVNDKDIPIYVNTVSYSDGSVSIPSIFVMNDTYQTISVMTVDFIAKGGEACNFSGSCLTSNTYGYGVVPGPGIAQKDIRTGIGPVISPKSSRTF